MEVHAQGVLFRSATRLIALQKTLIIAGTTGTLSTGFSLLSSITMTSMDCEQ